MYQLRCIGKLQMTENQAEILIHLPYRKALKSLEMFSHIHIFYIHKEDSRLQLNTCIVKIESVELKTGSIRISHLKHSLISTNGLIPKESVMNLREINDEEMSLDLDIVDIKPYFPCEDAVRKICRVNEKIKRPIVEKQKDSYEIYDIGMIRNTHGKIYIQLKDWIEIKSEYVKVLWWFNRYDEPKYRRAVECNPPYENAPRMGIFATRSPVRPNPIAMTVARVIESDRDKKRIYLSGIESFDQTPCVGLLEYDKETCCINEVSVPDWLSHWPKYIEDERENTLEDKENQRVDRAEKNGSLSQFMHMTQKGKEEQGWLLNEYSLKEGISIEEKLEVKEKLQGTLEHVKKDGIWICGAKENNLKNLSLMIPKHQITAVVGVSGSGKSSLVKDTIYAECKRRMAYLNHDQNSGQKPKVDYISGCMPAVMISQKEIKGNIYSTVGTYTNAYDDLRIIFSEVGIRHCPRCGGEIIPLTQEQIIQLLKKQEQVKIFDLNKNPIQLDKNCLEVNREFILENRLEQEVKEALKIGKGAFYAVINQGDYLLFQTRQKCYQCDHLMFELTPSTFSYMDLESRCPICHGTGKQIKVDKDKVIEHPEKSLLDGACSFLGKLRNFMISPNANWMKGQVFGLASQMAVDLEEPWESLPQIFKEKFLQGTGKDTVTFNYDNQKTGRKGEITRPVEGIIGLIERLYQENTQSKSLLKYMTEQTCTHCNGEKLSREGRMVTIGTLRYPEVASMSFLELGKWCDALTNLLCHAEYEKIENQVAHLKELVSAAQSLGIEYLEMNRETGMLSGGEGQRLKLLAAMQNHMTGLLYVFDEPSKGLNPKDYGKVIEMIQALKEEGNTIIMVEHNEEMIQMADHIIEIGPKAGEAGGYLMAAGTLEGVLHHSATQMSQYMNKPLPRIIPNKTEEEALAFIEMHHLNHHNLKDISIKFPKKALTCICGMSGSGKSSLMKGEIYPRFSGSTDFEEVCLVDQLPIGRSSRSVVATYIEVMDSIREKMAHTQKAIKLGYDEKAFSFSGEIGQCIACKGEGHIKLKYLEDALIVCPQCKGKRYKKEILQVTYKNKNIAQLLEMSVEEAKAFWLQQSESLRDNEAISAYNKARDDEDTEGYDKVKDDDRSNILERLGILEEVGLGYLKLGQSTITLSGGEASRLKLAKKLMESRKIKAATKSHLNENKKGILYLLDEPTTGLHFSDIEHILHLMYQLIQEGNTIVVIEHNKQFVANCHWKIELGPGAGIAGGSLISQGRCQD